MGKDRYPIYIRPRIPEIYNWLLDGETIHDIAKRLNTTKHTLDKYINKYPEFRDVYDYAIEKTKGIIQVAAIKKALGGGVFEEITETIERAIIGEDDEGKPIFSKTGVYKIKKVTKKTQMDSTMLKFLLCNYMPEKYSTDSKEEADGAEGVQFIEDL